MKTMQDMCVMRVFEQNLTVRLKWMRCLDETIATLFGEEVAQTSTTRMAPQFAKLLRHLAEFRPILALRFVEGFTKNPEHRQRVEQLSAVSCRLPDHACAMEAIIAAYANGSIKKPEKIYEKPSEMRWKGEKKDDEGRNTQGNC